MYGDNQRSPAGRRVWPALLGFALLLILVATLSLRASSARPVTQLAITPVATRNAALLANTGQTAAPTATTGVVIIPATGPQLPCTYPAAFWRDHPEAWLTENIIFGRFTLARAELQEILNAAPQDLKRQLIQQFIAATFNELQGADASVLGDALGRSAAWLETHWLNTTVSPADEEEGWQLLAALADFNHGITGPGQCGSGVLAMAPPATALVPSAPAETEPAPAVATSVVVATATPIIPPTALPSATPTAIPTALPTNTPTAIPTATPTAAPTATPTATLAPTVSVVDLPAEGPAEAAVDASIEAFIRDYFVSINNRDYEKTWSMLSDAFKDQYHCCDPAGGYEMEPYVQWWNTVSLVEVLGVRVDERSPGAARVTVSLRFTYQNGNIAESTVGYGLTVNPATGSWQFLY